MKQANLSKNIFDTFAAKILAFVLAFGASAFITRLLGPAGKGVQIFINTNVSLLTIILGLNINAFMMYFSATDAEQKRRAMGFSLISLGGLFILFMSIFWTLKSNDSQILGMLIPDKYLKGIYPYYFSGFLFISMLGLIIQGFWKGSKLFKWINLMVILAAGIKLVVYGAAFAGEKLEIVDINLEETFLIIIGTLGLIFLIRLGLFLFKSNFEVDFRIKSNLPVFMGFLNFGYLAALMNFANKRIDIWFIEHYNTIQELGFYGLAGQLSNLFIVVVLPATGVISPYLTNSNRETQEKIISRFSRFISSFALLVIALVFATAWFLIPLVFGEDFVQSIQPTKILIIGAMIMLFKNTFSVFNYSQNTVKHNFHGNLIAVFFTIILDFILIPKIGIMGAAYASVVAYFASSTYIFYSVYKKFNLRVKDYFILNKSDVLFFNNKLKLYLNRR